MRMTGIGVIAAALLVGNMGIAGAQTSSTTTSPSTAATVKCWDSTTKQVRNESPSTSSGSSMSGTSSTSSIGSTSSSTSARPAEAAGLPDCRN